NELHLLNEYRLSQSLEDPDPGVRLNAIQISERFAPGSEFLTRSLNHLATDRSPQVRFQTALSLGYFTDARSQKSLETILFNNRGNYWIRVAALSSLRSPVESFQPILDRLGTNQAAGDIDLVRDLADVSVARSDYP